MRAAPTISPADPLLLQASPGHADCAARQIHRHVENIDLDFPNVHHWRERGLNLLRGGERGVKIRVAQQHRKFVAAKSRRDLRLWQGLPEVRSDLFQYLITTS